MFRKRNHKIKHESHCFKLSRLLIFLKVYFSCGKWDIKWRLCGGGIWGKRKDFCEFIGMSPFQKETFWHQRSPSPNLRVVRLFSQRQCFSLPLKVLGTALKSNNNVPNKFLLQIIFPHIRSHFPKKNPKNNNNSSNGQSLSICFTPIRWTKREFSTL